MIEIVEYTRKEYLFSVQQIEDYDTLKFSKQALDWWDNYYSWIKEPPLCLKEDGKDMCYLFYSLSNDNEYLTIHNIFTPKKHRFKGFAYILLKYLFQIYSKNNIKRFKMYCVSNSIKFYLKLGLKFWGVNAIGQYYCDFKMPKSKIDELKEIGNKENIENINLKNFKKIYEKLKLNGKEFDEKQTLIHKSCLNLMGEKYLFKDVDRRNSKLII